MAIGADRVGIKGLTESKTIDFTSASDSLNKATKSVSDLANNGVNILNGVSNKAKNILSKPSIKEMNVDTSGLGMFESILCGKIPSLNIRLPSFDFEFDTKFDGFNIEICGKTKNINPIDTALTIVEGLTNPKKFIGEQKNKAINGLLNTELGKQLNSFGLTGIPECLTDRSKWDLINGDFAGVGSSLEERVDLYKRLKLDGCSENIAGMMGVPRIVKESAMTNILDSLSGNSEKLAKQYFKKAYTTDGTTTLSSVRNSLVKNSTGNYLPKLSFISSTICNGNTSSVSNIISSNSRTLNTTHSTNVKTEDLASLRLDTKATMKSLSNVKDEELNLIDPNTTILAINTLDPKWNRDSDDNLTSYKLSNNKVMDIASEKMVLSKKPNINLTGNTTTNLNLMDELYIINKVKYA